MFRCDSDNIEFVMPEGQPIMQTECKPRFNSHDMHVKIHLCYEMMQNSNWGMCHSERDFSERTCKAENLILGKYIMD